MKNLVLLAFAACASTALCQETVIYQFSPPKPLVYAMEVKGTLSIVHEGAPSDTFSVSLTGNLGIETVASTDDTFTLRVTPRKTVVVLNEMVMEDISSSETMASQIISTLGLDIARNGKILKTKELSRGMVSIAHFFHVLPAFPERDFLPGKPWRQSVSSFRFPLFPMPSLEFIYTCNVLRTDRAEVSFIAAPLIREKIEQNESSVAVNGKNSSSGRILFNREKGQIENVLGTLDLDMKALFTFRNQGAKPREALPLSSRTKLKFTLLKL